MGAGGLQELRDSIAPELEPAKRQRCREGKCSLLLEGIGDFLLLKGDVVRTDVKMCDCIIFLDSPSPTIVLAELKGKTVHASEAQEKIQNAAAVAAEITAKCETFRSCSRLLALVLARKWTVSAQKVLGRLRVTFAGRRYRIHHARCGKALSCLLAKFLS